MLTNRFGKFVRPPEFQGVDIKSDAFVGKMGIVVEEQGLFELKIAKLENILSRARIIEKSNTPSDKITILSTVSVKNLNNNNIIEYTLVSPEEADFQAGKISVTSPVGQGLIGKTLGEKIKVKAPAGMLEFEILSIK